MIEVFDLPVSVPEVALFGAGAAHAHASPTLSYTAPTEVNDIRLPEGMRRELERRVTAALEFALLASVVPEGVPPESRLMLGNLKSLNDERFVDGQQRVAEAVAQLGREHLDDLMLATAFTDILDPLIAACTHLGVPLDDALSNT